MWTDPLACFDQENVVEVMFWNFAAQALRGFVVSTFTFKTQPPCKEIQAILLQRGHLEKEVTRRRTEARLPTASTKLPDAWMRLSWISIAS